MTDVKAAKVSDEWPDGDDAVQSARVDGSRHLLIAVIVLACGQARVKMH